LGNGAEKGSPALYKAIKKIVKENAFKIFPPYLENLSII